MNKWWIYQKERFPLVAHSLLIVVFSTSAIGHSQLVNHSVKSPSILVFIASFFSSLFFFMLLRIADEFKDFADDVLYRPYRPVPRGLISLKELGLFASVLILLQLLLAYVTNSTLLPILIITWIYLALMSKEFFINQWLKQHQVTYMLSHMLIMPLLALYASAFEWRNALSTPGIGFLPFLVISFLNGITLEIGRKIRAPENEETGVETYSFLWGSKKATLVWLVSMLASFGLCLIAMLDSSSMFLTFTVLGLILLYVMQIARKFIQKQSSFYSKRIENISAIWVLATYILIGIIPLIKHTA